MAKKGDPIKVEWLDSMSASGWHIYDDETDLKCSTIGHFIKKNETGIVIALNKSVYGYGEYITIPSCAIKRVKKLK